MKHTPYEDFITRYGQPVTETADGELALTKAHALKALEILTDCRVGILGGDVYELESDGYFRPTYDSWYCEKTGFIGTEFIEISIKKAIQYLNDYQEPAGSEIRYVLVIDI